MAEPQCDVGVVIQKIAASQGLNATVEGISELCYGCAVTSDKSFVQFCQQHGGAFNFQVVDGDPVRIVRRKVNGDLTIDRVLRQSEMIVSNQAPAIKLVRVDPLTLPRQIELQYSDPARDYANATQVARHEGAPKTNGTTSQFIDFVIDADMARTIAFEWLYRMWGQTLTLTFEHPDLRIEPADVLLVEAATRSYTVLVQKQTITQARTNQIAATVLLTSSGIVIAGGMASSYDFGSVAITNEYPPQIISDGAGDTAAISVIEGRTAVTQVQAEDQDPVSYFTFSISGGDDAAKFSIDPITGILAFILPPSFASPTDADMNNTYIVEVQVSDQLHTDTQTITVTVTEDTAPSITSSPDFSIASGATFVGFMTVTDPDPGTVLTFTITGGDDAAFFNIDSGGNISFNSAPDYGSPADANADNNYQLEVTVSDGLKTDSQAITVTVTP